MIHRAELKLTSKMRMAQADPSYVKVMLLWVLAAVVVPQVANSFVSTSMSDVNSFSELIAGGIDPEVALRVLQLSGGQLLSAWALDVVLYIYQLIMSFGLALYCLRLYRGDPCGPGELFAGFSMAGRVIGAELVVVLIAVAFAIVLAFPLAAVMAFGFLFLHEDLALVVAYAAVIAYAVAVVVILLRYAMTSFALADRPELGAMGAIQYGKDRLRGHLGQYFLLCLSFFGWMLLCELPALLFSSVTVGVAYLSAALPAPIGSLAAAVASLPAWATNLISVVLMLPYYLWLAPYMNTTLAGFYENLRSDRGFVPPMPPPMPPL